MSDPLEALRRAFAPQTQRAGSGNYYPFFLMKDDEQATIRFLPDNNPENPRLFLVEKLDHRLEINGETKTTPCLSQYGEECPICTVAQRYYKQEGDDSVNGRKYYKKRKYIGQILVVEDPLPVKEGEESNVGKVMYITLGFQIYNVMKQQVDRGFIDALPYDYKNGYDFIIVKSSQGSQYSTYAVGSTFARKARTLDAETIAMVEENIVDLSTLIPANPGVEKTESLLNAALTGEDYNDAADTAPIPPRQEAPVRERVEIPPTREVVSAPLPTNYDEDVPMDKGNVAVTTTPSTTTPSTPAVESSGSDDGEDILAQIKARRKNKAS